MFVRIRNTPIDYAWGTDGEITRLLGDGGVCEVRRDGRPEAELWLGAHPGEPSRIADADRGLVDGAADLREWIEADPAATLGQLAGGLHDGDGPVLPFLLKVLAAGAPLSLQAHPSLEHARAGFARENELGIPIDAPVRNYRDPLHKPELLLALSETMEALAGFRVTADVVDVLESLEAAAHGGAIAPEHRDALAALRARVAAVTGEGERRGLVAWLLARGDDALAATEAVVAAARAAQAPALHAAPDAVGASCASGASGASTASTRPAAGSRDAAASTDVASPASVAVDTVTMLADRYPGDPGIVIALLLNRISLRRGEALFVGAGSMHAYLRGVGVEIMAASDNVLRGGLTPKHVEVGELLHILNADETADPRLEPVALGGGATAFEPDVPDFRLVRVMRGDDADAGDAAVIDAPGPAIILCLSGEGRVSGRASETRISAGDAAYVTPDEGLLEVRGTCDLLVATVGVGARSKAV
ncbi:MAG: type I phosphomannose isomerase catalytic subunit [Pseudoclavibacter sp.]